MKIKHLVSCMIVLTLGITSAFLRSSIATGRQAYATTNGLQPKFTMAVLSDIHVTDAKTRWANMARKKFDQALTDIESYKPDVTVINGDLTNGNPGDYIRLQQIINRHNLGLLYATMGNHEYYRVYKERQWTDEDAKHLFMHHFKLNSPYYDRYIHGYHLLFLAPEVHKSIRGIYPDAAWLSRTQLDWFRERLQKPSAGTFVFLRQPLDQTVAVDNNRVQTVQTNELKQIAQQHVPIIWFSGHTHLSVEYRQQVVEQAGILYVGGGSTFTVATEKRPHGGTLTKQFNITFRESQSRLVMVYSDHVKILARDHQHHRWLHAYDISFRIGR
jgi:3',5'-cyclic-AMP phosphodiesterase